MPDVRISEDLWGTGLLPEGVLERWLVTDGTRAQAGQPLALVRIGEALHEIMAPVSGRLTMVATSGAIVDPGCVIGEIDG